MRVVSPLLKRVVYPGLAAGGFLRLNTPPGLAVVTYHGVLPAGYKPIDPGFDGSLITAETFRQQLRLLKAHYQIVSPDEMRSWCRREFKLPPRAVLLTCDDGFLNNLTEMLPILQEEKLRCLFFVTGASLGGQRTMMWYEELFLMFRRARAGSFRILAGGVGIEGVLGDNEQRRTLWWNIVRRLSQVDAASRRCFIQKAHEYFGLDRSLDFYLGNYAEAPRHFCLMTRQEVVQLAQAGMTIGAHTSTHPVLPQAPAELAWSEIIESRAELETLLGTKIWAFAYPFGDAASVSPGIIAMVKRAKFEAAFVNTGGGLGADLPLHAIPRVHVSAGMGLAEFEAHIAGLHRRLQRGKGRVSSQDVPVLDAVHI